MADVLRRVQREIRDVVLEDLAANVDARTIRDHVRGVLSSHGHDLADDLMQQMIDEAAAQYDWITPRTLAHPGQAAIADILTNSAPQFAAVASGIEERTLRLVGRALRDGLSSKEIENALLHDLGKPIADARTITNTSLQAFGRVGTLRQAEQAGQQFLQYLGPGAEREFCIKMLAWTDAGRVWTRGEIAKLSNGQGLPVLQYCGGYNCRHFWEVVFGHVVYDAANGFYRLAA